jgi:1-acyl-sn-glycerol-3-phosphate acyltransferase
MRNILGRIFALWAALIFIPTMLVAFILILIASLFNEPTRTQVFHQITRVWMGIFLTLSGIRFKVKGKDKFKKGEAYIVCCNHNSLMDVPLTTPFIPGANKTIAKKEMASIPIFGIIYKAGSVLIDRKSEDSRKAGFDAMKKVLMTGMHMCVYPEGTRNKTAEPLQPFYNGAFKLSTNSGKAIMPAVIFNTAKVLPVKKTFFFWPVKIEMHFLDPIYPGNDTVDQLKEKTFAIMKDYYVRNRKDQ